MSAGDRSTRYDCEGDTDGKGEPNLQDVTVEWDWQCTGTVDGERGHRSNAWEDVEKHAGSFGHHLAKDARAGMLKVQFPLRDRRRLNDMSGDVPLEGFRGANFNFMSVEATQIAIAIPVRHYVNLSKETGDEMTIRFERLRRKVLNGT